jgi:hypothetical protein
LFADPVYYLGYTAYVTDDSVTMEYCGNDAGSGKPVLLPLSTIDPRLSRGNNLKKNLKWFTPCMSCVVYFYLPIKYTIWVKYNHKIIFYSNSDFVGKYNYIIWSQLHNEPTFVHLTVCSNSHMRVDVQYWNTQQSAQKLFRPYNWLHTI